MARRTTADEIGVEIGKQVWEDSKEKAGLKKYSVLFPDWEKVGQNGRELLRSADQTPPLLLFYAFILLKKWVEIVHLDARDHEDVFRILNIAREETEPVYRGRSMSVGDILVDHGQHKVFRCAPAGWQELGTLGKSVVGSLQ